MWTNLYWSFNNDQTKILLLMHLAYLQLAKSINSSAQYEAAQIFGNALSLMSLMDRHGIMLPEFEINLYFKNQLFGPSIVG